VNSLTKDILLFARTRGISIILYRNRHNPITVPPSRITELLTEPSYEWNMKDTHLKLFSAGYDGPNSPFKKAS